MTDRARFAATILSSLLPLALLLLAHNSSADEAPAASAPLPPPLAVTPFETGAPQGASENPSQTTRPDQPNADPLAVSVGGSKSRSPQRKPTPASSPNHVSGFLKKPDGHVRPGNYPRSRASSHSGGRALASGERKRPSVRHQAGYLSPPADLAAAPPVESATSPPPAPPRRPMPYYPSYPAVPPTFGYAAPYPYPWATPGAGPYR